MRFLSVFCFFALVLASAVEKLKDTFLQQHLHRILPSRKNLRDRNPQFHSLEHIDLVRSIDICLRHLEGTGMGEAAKCMAQNWRSSMAAPAMLSTFAKKGLKSVANEVEMTEDGTVQVDESLGITWVSSGTMTIDGTSVPYNRNGQFGIQGSIFFQDTASVTQDRLNASFVVYLQVDLQKLRDSDDDHYVQSLTRAKRIGKLVARHGDGSVEETVQSGHFTVNSLTYPVSRTGKFSLATEANVTSFQIKESHVIRTDGSVEKHQSSQSDILDVLQGLSITYSPSGSHLFATAYVGGVSKISKEQAHLGYTLELHLQDKATFTSVEGLLNVSGQQVEASKLVLDFEGRPTVIVTGLMDIEGTFEAKDDSVDYLEVHTKGVSKTVVSPEGSGTPEVIDSSSTVDLSFKSMSHDDFTLSEQFDLKSKDLQHKQ